MSDEMMTSRLGTGVTQRVTENRLCEIGNEKQVIGVTPSFFFGSYQTPCA